MKKSLQTIPISKKYRIFVLFETRLKPHFVMLRNTFQSTIASWKWWQQWIWILLGCSIMGTAYVLFINPYNFVPGGVYGLAIVMHNIFPSIQVGTFSYMFDIPLMITALPDWFVGAYSGASQSNQNGARANTWRILDLTRCAMGK